ncbi:MAG: redoxin domain-containing protein [Candidatus Atribacteria bacterium]|nr:redoxin domain-containing protein [Candidatus Atribacteria bacterium]
MFKKRTKNFSINTIIFIIVAVVGIFFLTFSSSLAQYKVGSPAPDFSLNTLDGKAYQLNQFLNKQQHLMLCFIDIGDETSVGKLEDLIAFFYDYQPQESYQIVAIFEKNEDTDVILENFTNLTEETGVPFIMLWDEQGKVNAEYGIEGYPTILMLRSDLYIRKAYDLFTKRHETSFYQYLSFTFSSRKAKESSSSGCDDGCSPPPDW